MVYGFLVCGLLYGVAMRDIIIERITYWMTTCPDLAISMDVSVGDLQSLSNEHLVDLFEEIIVWSMDDDV